MVVELLLEDVGDGEEERVGVDNVDEVRRECRGEGVFTWA